MVDQLSLEMKGTITISIPTEDNTAITIDAQIALEMKQLGEDEVHNLGKKEQTIMRYGELATMMQHQEEDEAQKLVDK